jgi:hypothetical protein
VRGIRSFRERCRLAVEDGSLVVSDEKGRERRFRLDGSEQAPARYVFILGRPWWMIVDGQGEGIVRGAHEDWDWKEITEVTEPAGISTDSQTEKIPDPPLRHDAVLLEEPRWVARNLTLVPLLGAFSLAAAAGAQQGVIPIWVAVVYFAAVLGLAVRGFSAGALAPARRSKSTPEIEAFLAEQGVKPGWQPPLPPKWRLAAEFQFGTYFLLALVSLIQGELMGALMALVVSLVFFGITRWTMSGSPWAWWTFIVIGNVGGVATLIAVVFGQ